MPLHLRQPRQALHAPEGRCERFSSTQEGEQQANRLPHLLGPRLERRRQLKPDLVALQEPLGRQPRGARLAGSRLSGGCRSDGAGGAAAATWGKLSQPLPLELPLVKPATFQSVLPTSALAVGRRLVSNRNCQPPLPQVQAAPLSQPFLPPPGWPSAWSLGG